MFHFICCKSINHFTYEHFIFDSNSKFPNVTSDNNTLLFDHFKFVIQTSSLNSEAVHHKIPYPRKETENLSTTSNREMFQGGFYI